MNTTTETIDLDTLADRLSSQARDRRIVVAIAGAPGSGKSTVAGRLVDRLNAAAPGIAALLPMDGFHYDNTLLTQLDLLARKGAPNTFDVDGFRHTLLRLRDNGDASVAVPVFDREIEIARAGARLISRQSAIIVAEGNYLLLQDAPWSALRPLFDLTVFVDVSLATLRERLTARWQGYGLSAEEIRRKVEENDLPNGELVIESGSTADYRLPNPALEP